MPRRRWIDKKTAAHFTLVHRPQNDPRIHDEAAPAMVLNPTPLPNVRPGTDAGTGPSSAGHRAQKLDELAAQLGDEAARVRANEGEAANYGVFFDDSAYDYMQHLREIGTGAGEAVFVEAPAAADHKKKQKQKQTLDEALAAAPADPAAPAPPLLDDDILPAKHLQAVTYQNMQDVPDAIAGFQPDMDPRLREVLEALEDDAFVDDDADNDALFQQLAQDGTELDRDEFEETYDEVDEGDEDGWASDATEKPGRSGDGGAPQLVDVSQTGDADADAAAAAGPSDDWMENFRQFKKDQASSASTPAAGQKKTAAAADVQSSVWTTTTAGGRKKKRKGALTQQSGFSMTSSSLVRTEQLSLLDARFDQVDALYNADEDDDITGGGDDLQSVSAFSSASSVTGPLRHDFDSILDDFLGGYSMQGKRHIKKGRAQTGLEQLDEIRHGLGPARLPGKAAARR